jgi:hypothetical protein
VTLCAINKISLYAIFVYADEFPLYHNESKNLYILVIHLPSCTCYCLM